MVTRRRRPLKSVVHSNSAGRTSLTTQVVQAATSRTARAVYIGVGTVGLAALAVAIFGPRRFEREILRPTRDAVVDQAGKLWNDARPLRDQIAQLLDRAGSPSGREKLVRNFQSWVGHFRAT